MACGLAALIARRRTGERQSRRECPTLAISGRDRRARFAYLGAQHHSVALTHTWWCRSRRGRCLLESYAQPQAALPHSSCHSANRSATAANTGVKPRPDVSPYLICAAACRRPASTICRNNKTATGATKIQANPHAVSRPRARQWHIRRARRELESFLDRYGLGRDSQDPFAQSDEGNDHNSCVGAMSACTI